VYLLAALESVDTVVVFDTLTATEVLTAVEPDIYVKGGDYDVNTIPTEERAALEAMHSRIVFLPFVDGFSTTALIRKIHQHRQPG
jgi:bifunctional ADP-heptose synthase (sugar kinase/adenylyltransferase)